MKRGLKQELLKFLNRDLLILNDQADLQFFDAKANSYKLRGAPDKTIKIDSPNIPLHDGEMGEPHRRVRRDRGRELRLDRDRARARGIAPDVQRHGLLGPDPGASAEGSAADVRTVSVSESSGRIRAASARGVTSGLPTTEMLS